MADIKDKRAGRRVLIGYLAGQAGYQISVRTHMHRIAHRLSKTRCKG